LGGTPQILVVTVDRLVAHEPAAGHILWSVPWHNNQATNCSQPIPLDAGSVFISANYGLGCARIDAAPRDSLWQAAAAWSSRTLQTKFCSAVVRDGYAYSLDDEILECVSVADGRRQWKRGRYGHGQLLLADDLLVIQAEDGRVALVEATPAEYRELASMQAVDGKTWNNPSLAGRQLFVRNDRQAACYELPGAE
jgi:outer membrane protein assembly factor BamB